MSTNPITRHLLALALLLGVLLPLAGCATVQRPASTPSLAVTHVTVIDVESGTRLPDHTVVVEGDRITAVGPSAAVAVPAGAAVVDGTGRFLIPGLWDMHGHLLGRWDAPVVAPLFVVNGVTGVREMWTDWLPDSLLATGRTELGEALWMRDEIRAGRLVGPRFVFAGAPLDGAPGTEAGVVVVRDAAEARAAVDAQAAQGVETVGPFLLLSREAFVAAAEQARARGLAFAGLKPEALTFEEAAPLLRSRESLAGWSYACSSEADTLLPLLRAAVEADARDTTLAAGDAYGGDGQGQLAGLHRDWTDRANDTFDRARCEALARRVAAFPSWQVPRLARARSRSLGYAEQDPADERLAYVPAEDGAVWRQQRAAREALPPDSARAVAAKGAADWARTVRLVGLLHRAGVPFLAGTETWEPFVPAGFSLHDELALLVEAGFSPLDALRTATWEPARYFDATDKMGSVATGKLADLVLLDADPLTDIRATTQIRAVVLDGRYLDRAALDGLLDEVATTARTR